MVTNKINRAAFLAFVLAMLVLTTGCLYPKDRTPGHDASIRGAVLTMQDAVDRYYHSTGLLPLVNADAKVPLYEKYKIDFAKLKRMGYLDSVPDAAFENGGAYIFLIIDEETKPQVKLLDLTVYQGIASVQTQVKEYRLKHGGDNPSGNEAYPGFRYVDFDKLGVSRPDLSSMYSRHPLELILDEEGKVYGDYGSDIAAAVQKTGSSPAAEEDLRHRLVDASYFVPVAAPVYHWVKEAPVAVKP